MSDAQILDFATKANAVLENAAYQAAYAAVRQRLLDAMIGLQLSDAEGAEHCRQAVKLLDSLKAELDTAVKSGKIAAANIAEIEARRKNPLRGIFR